MEENIETEEIKKVGTLFGEKSSFLGLSILASAVIVAGTLIYVFGPAQGVRQVGDSPAPTNGEAAGVGLTAPEISNAPALGDSNAPVTIVEYSDYECPFCGKFFDESLDQVKSEYVDTGKVRFVYKDFPLTSIHFQAQKAAESARCVRDQLGDDGYWRMHDRLFEGQQLLGVTSFKQWARDIGVSGDEFDNCLDSGKYASAVSDDLEEGVALGVNGTPTFFINGTVVVGAQPFAQIAAVIEAELAKTN